MGTFGAAYGWWGAKRPPLPKICHTHPTMIKLGTVIPCLKKIQKIYESRDTPSEFCISALFHRKSANFVISRNTDIECILLHNFLNRVKQQKSIFKFNINMVMELIKRLTLSLIRMHTQKCKIHIKTALINKVLSR